ncbi:uncharacterized protein CLUP02_05917 [Colletotrichum lupini]|uniref:Uncharacterized protein n=1 Tax=Colletotrichum lupini TaxID=145971 RepID=A0A9Q8SN37_9PEZI|nr:uncharacterized protein CLUP02_05917 [Colletotrichum lupini]UQC80434.1 hypothetical protein CLUP02_05917 [Colletotrichum lupini]
MYLYLYLIHPLPLSASLCPLLPYSSSSSPHLPLLSPPPISKLIGSDSSDLLNSTDLSVTLLPAIWNIGYASENRIFIRHFTNVHFTPDDRKKLRSTACGRVLDTVTPPTMDRARTQPGLPDMAQSELGMAIIAINGVKLDLSEAPGRTRRRLHASKCASIPQHSQHCEPSSSSAVHNENKVLSTPSPSGNAKYPGNANPGQLFESKCESSVPVCCAWLPDLASLAAKSKVKTDNLGSRTDKGAAAPRSALHCTATIPRPTLSLSKTRVDRGRLANATHHLKPASPILADDPSCRAPSTSATGLFLIPLDKSPSTSTANNQQRPVHIGAAQGKDGRCQSAKTFTCFTHYAI